MRTRRRRNLFGVSAILAVCFMTSGGIAAEYNITGSVDFTGPYAVVMPPIDETADIFFAWWNEEVGSKIGVKLNRKSYDTRYDPAITASLWPGILSGDKPLAHLGLGGPDVAALMKRLPEDKVPLIMSTGTYGFAWLPNQWVFQPRPTYVHESVGFFNWVKQNWKEKRPIRVGGISFQGSPAYVDGVNGFQKYDESDPMIEYVGTEWVKFQPETLVTEINRLSKKKPDYLFIMTNTYQGVGTIKAQKELGIHIPVVLSSHNGIQMSAMATKDMKLLEGHYDSASIDPGIDPNLPAAQVFEKYKKKLGKETKWSILTGQAAVMTLLSFRAVERAVKEVGADKLTGAAIYKAMYVGPFAEKEDLLGIAPTLTFTKDAPFSTKDIKVKATSVKEGKQVMVSQDWIPVPEVPKWAEPEKK